MPDILLWIIGIGAGVGALGVIWTKALMPMWRLLRRFEDVHQLIIEDLPTFMAETNECLKELRPNGGGSIKDRVTLIDGMLRTHLADNNAHSPRVETRDGA